MAIFTLTLSTIEQLNEVLSHVGHSITAEYNEILLKPYSKEEIHAALLRMHMCKAPWSDGMHVYFLSTFLAYCRE